MRAAARETQTDCSTKRERSQSETCAKVNATCVKCSGRGEHEEGAREACVSTRQRDREVVAPLLTCPLLFLKRPLSRHQNVAFDALFLVLC